MKILTFDIEEWFHLLGGNNSQDARKWESYESRIHSNLDRILAILDRSGHSASFFCLGWIAEKYPEVIRKIDDAGYEIGTHSHLHRLIYNQSEADFKSDLLKSIHTIEDIIGKKITLYRAPGFSLRKEHKWVFELLAENGIYTDSSVFPVKRAYGNSVLPGEKTYAGIDSFESKSPSIIEVDGVRFKEFPMTFQSVFGKKIIFSGGGYFRFMPLMILKKLFEQSDYVMTYFHPRDFDPGQPVLEEITPIHKLRAYYGLKGSASKFETILQANQFCDVRTASKNIDWDRVPVTVL